VRACWFSRFRMETTRVVSKADFSPEEAKLRKQICKVGRLMHRQGYVVGGSGNISARLGPDRILITPSGPAKGFLKPDQLIVINLDGEKVGPDTDANRRLGPSSETPMHLECYRRRSDVNGVVHAHPPNAVALTITGHSLAQCVVPEIVFLMGIVPTLPYATPSTVEDRDAISEAILHNDALMLAYHGSLTVGPDVWTAYMRLETLEHYASILSIAYMLGGPRPLQPEQIEKLLAVRQQLGLLRESDPELFRKTFGVHFVPADTRSA
jgi:L-fuculose-phosphate aldolase